MGLDTTGCFEGVFFFFCFFFLAIFDHRLFSIHILKEVCGYIVLVINGQQAFYILLIGKADMQPMITDTFLQLAQGAFAHVRLQIPPQNQNKFSCRSGR